MKMSRQVKREVKDRGSYLLLLRIDSERRIGVGKLGDFIFPRGHYVYVGSAMRNLSARMARHSRLRKKLHWHIDYLRHEADGFVGLPVRSSQRLECEIAEALSKTFSAGPARFGSSDCKCRTHLFYSDANPIEQVAFHQVLQRFRMRAPDGKKKL
jgi:sugar fermentation stimulation protein A